MPHAGSSASSLRGFLERGAIEGRWWTPQRLQRGLVARQRMQGDTADELTEFEARSQVAAHRGSGRMVWMSSQLGGLVLWHTGRAAIRCHRPRPHRSWRHSARGQEKKEETEEKEGEKEDHEEDEGWGRRGYRGRTASTTRTPRMPMMTRRGCLLAATVVGARRGQRRIMGTSPQTVQSFEFVVVRCGLTLSEPEGSEDIEALLRERGVCKFDTRYAPRHGGLVPRHAEAGRASPHHESPFRLRKAMCRRYCS